MILFYDDWDYYPSATIHKETTNTSFIELAKLYRDMGIKNNAFHLALINPHLRYVDPFSPDLDQDTIDRIVVECKINPWYFMREVLRAPARGGTKSIPVRANRSNVALWWLFLNHCTVYLIQPRQTGKSFNTDGLMTWLLGVRCDNTAATLLTKDDALRRKNIDRIKDIFSDLPWYLDMRGRNDSNNGEEVTIRRKGNTYSTIVGQQSPKAALKAARGFTTGIVHIDEGPFIPNIGTMIPAALPAMTAAIEGAMEAGAPYGIIYTTTAGRRDDPDGKFVYQMVQESMVLDERKLFDCKDQKEMEQVVRSHSRPDRSMYKNGVYQVNCTFSHRQLGLTDEWLLEAMERTKSVGDDANRDYFNIWTAGNEKSPLSVQDAEAIALHKQEDVKEEIYAEGCTLRWYIDEEERSYYLQKNSCILGLDTSDASGSDDIGLVIVDVKSLKVIAAGTYNNLNLFSFCKYILQLLIDNPKLVFIPEAKSSGVAIINYLLVTLPSYGINPFTRIFNKIVQEKNDSEIGRDNYKEVMRDGKKEIICNKYKKSFGYATSASGQYSRDSLYGQCFREAISRCKEKIKDPVLSDQLLRLVIKNGRIDHDEYGHDDMVISWLLCMWMITNGKNLEAYDIDSHELMSKTNEKPIETVHDYMDYLESKEQEDLRKRMIELYSELESTTDYYLTMKLENELRALDNKLVGIDRNVFSISQLIEKAREKRKARRMNSLISNTVEVSVPRYNYNNPIGY